jgi:hypothetical protein
VLGGGLISLWLYKENNKLRDWKNIFTLHIPPWAPHTYDFVVLTSLTHARETLLVALQIGKAKDLSAPLRIHHHQNPLESTIYGIAHYNIFSFSPLISRDKDEPTVDTTERTKLRLSTIWWVKRIAGTEEEEMHTRFICRILSWERPEGRWWGITLKWMLEKSGPGLWIGSNGPRDRFPWRKWRCLRQRGHRDWTSVAREMQSVHPC